ncbi:hypothetical protein OH687_28080 [Burkholderia anthina]|nr:hypothetical protein OH687_28080 [Burkholderia anthina]
MAAARALRTGELSMLQILTRSFTAAHPGRTDIVAPPSANPEIVR